MDGTCDVPGCTNETYMGWRPLTEPKGKQICLPHWNRHKDPDDSFNLWDAFGFKRPAKRLTGPLKEKPEIAKQAKKRQKQAGGAVPLKSAEAPMETRRELAALAGVSHEAQQPIPEPAQNDGPRCKACGGEREAGFTYCPSCAKERAKRSNRQRRMRAYREARECSAFVPELT